MTKISRVLCHAPAQTQKIDNFSRCVNTTVFELRGTGNVQGQISEHIFAPNGGYGVYYPSNRLRNARSFENWGIFNNYFLKSR